MTITIANKLAIARASQQTIESDAYPTSEDAAYRIQDSIVSQSSDTLAGFKIGATNAGTQAMLGLHQPFFGPVFSNDVYDQSAGVPVPDAYPVKVETEFVVGIGCDISGRQGCVKMDEVLAAIDWIAPGFEFIGSRFKTLPEKPGLCAIADGGGSHNVVLGLPVHDWRALDLQQHSASLAINDITVASGHSGDSIAGSPMGMLHWLLNLERFDAKTIQAGQFVFCGTCTPPAPVVPGDTLKADFGALGMLHTHCHS